MRFVVGPAEAIPAASSSLMANAHADPDGAVRALTSAYPWPDSGETAVRPWWRGMMVSSLGGSAAGPDGLSGSISSPADRLVLKAVRQFADAIVIGAQTFRSERYRPLKAENYPAAQRNDLGLATAPQLVIVTSSGDLPWDEDAFHSSTLSVLIVTPDAAAPWLASAPAGVDVLELPDAEYGRMSGVDIAGLPQVLAERGLCRVVCEGGPALMDQLVGADLLDELDLSISPVLTTGPSGSAQLAVHHARAMQLAHVIADDRGFLFTRYLRDRGSATSIAQETQP